MPRRIAYAVLLALPALVLAVSGLFHPHHLSYDTADQWFRLHVPGLLAFPLVGVALIQLVRGRADVVAWAARVAAFVYACVYTALDVVNGITAGYVTRELGPGVPRPVEIRLIFQVGRPMGEIGSWALVAACVLIAADHLLRRRTDRPSALLGLLLVPGAWLVHLDHIFSPKGVLGMVLIALGTAALAHVGDRAAPAEVKKVEPTS